MQYHSACLVLLLSAALPLHTLAQAGATNAPEKAVAQPQPAFPVSERSRDREGWVLVDLEIDGNGLVTESRVRESSGSDAFDEAALATLRDWRYGPSSESSSSVLVSFVYERTNPLLRRSFTSRYRKIHKAVDNGDIEQARELLDKARRDRNISSFELAYSYIAEGYIAAGQGDRSEQLNCFRKAMLSNGRWVGDEKYGKLLYATIVLEIQERDYPSALRDYTLLIEAAPGSAAARDLEEVMRQIRPMVENDDSAAPPFMFADLEVVVKTERDGFARNFDNVGPNGSGEIEEREFQRVRERQGQ